MIATSLVLILFVSWLLWHFLTYNSFVKNLNAIQQAWSNIEVELKRRLDLVGNLVEVVKGYTKHETETLLATIASRNKSASISDADSANNSNKIIKESLGQLFAIAEDYPDLKANNQFLELQKELSISENRIAERRHAYNQNVSYYENTRLSFPSSIVAKVHAFSAAALYDVEDTSINSPVTVKF